MTSEKPAVHLKEVAALAKVSVALASFALNGKPGVSEATRERILVAADRLGYRANPHAQALRRGRSSTYGLIVRNLANPFFLDVIGGAEEIAHSQDVTLLVLDSAYSLERELLNIERLAAYRVGGLAIAPVGLGESIRRWQALEPGASKVALNATASGIERVTRVAPDNEAAVRLPLERLAELGHAHVAMLSAPRKLMADSDRLRAFRRHARRLDVKGTVLTAPLTIQAVQAATEALLSGSGARPSAILANSDHAAHGMYKAARRMRVDIGRDLSIVGHDDLASSELLSPPLATLRLDRRSIGRELMTRLLDPDAREDHVEPVSLVERASMGAV